MQRSLLYCLIAVLLLGGCASQPETAAQLTPETTVSIIPATATREITIITATEEVTPEGPMRVSVWWPEALAPLDNETAAELLSEQLSAFQRANENLTIDFRLKRVEDVGGIMSTLRTASAVAPGALPDLTLLQRDDLLFAAQAGLIQPLSERLSPAIMEELPTPALELGRVGDQLYGLPYTLQVQHLVFSPGTDVERWSFDEILSEQIPFIFPASRTNGINDVLLLQYLEAGGVISEAGLVNLNTEALQTVLEFYEQLVDEGLITPAVLDFTSPAAYLESLLSIQQETAVIDSSSYLRLVSRGAVLDVGPIPTSSGEPITTLNGWMWVLTTADADRQARALRFLNWMMDADRQGQYTGVINMLPSQRAALRQVEDEAYAAFVSELLTNVHLTLADSESGAAARAMQNALITVIEDETTAEAATENVIDQLQG